MFFNNQSKYLATILKTILFSLICWLCPWHPYFSDCRSGDSTRGWPPCKTQRPLWLCAWRVWSWAWSRGRGWFREDADGGQVGGTGGGGFAVTTSWLHLQGGDNEHARCENDEQCHHLIKGGDSEKKQLAEIRVRIREGNQGRKLTEDVTDCVETVKR